MDGKYFATTLRNGKENLQQLLLDIRLSKPRRIKYQQVTDHVCKILETTTEAKTEEIVVGGSLGKGTATKDGKLADCELIVLFQDFDPTNHRKYLNDMFNIIKKKLRVSNDKPMLKWFFVSFDYHGILFTLYAGGKLPNGALTFNTNCNNKNDRQVWMPSANLLSVPFIKTKNAKYKDLVRIASFWLQFVCHWSEENPIYGSHYWVELLILFCFEQIPYESMSNIFHHFLKIIISSEEKDEKLEVIWEDFYPEKEIPQRLWDDDVLIMDPTNPQNNIYHSVKGIWPDIVKNAKLMIFYWDLQAEDSIDGNSSSIGEDDDEGAEPSDDEGGEDDEIVMKPREADDPRSKRINRVPSFTGGNVLKGRVSKKEELYRQIDFIKYETESDFGDEFSGFTSDGKSQTDKSESETELSSSSSASERLKRKKARSKFNCSYVYHEILTALALTLGIVFILLYLHFMDIIEFKQ